MPAGRTAGMAELRVAVPIEVLTGTAPPVPEATAGHRVEAMVAMLMAVRDKTAAGGRILTRLGSKTFSISDKEEVAGRTVRWQSRETA